MVSSVTDVGENLRQFRQNVHSYSVQKTQPYIREINQKPESKPSMIRRGTANAVGLGIGLAAPAYCLFDELHKITPREAKDAAKSMIEFIPEADTLEHTKEIAGKILEETGLKNKGVKINYIDDTKESLSHLKEIIAKTAKFNNAYGKRLRENYYETFKHGSNAAFFTDVNEVVVNSKNLFSTVYHELGHAMNKNGNAFTKGLQKLRVITPHGVSVFVPVALAVGLFHKVDDKKPQTEKSMTEKTLDFISNHAGAITFTGYLPMLTEEGLASVRGLMKAGKHLDRNIMKNLMKNYTKAWGTYAALAGVAAGGVTLGIEAAKQIRNNFE